MGVTRAEELKVYAVGARRFVFVPADRSDELRLHLESHGIQSVMSRIPKEPLDRLELVGDVDTEAAQAILDHWER